MNFRKQAILFIKLILFLPAIKTYGQSSETRKSGIILTEGILVTGYADKGAFLNFTGPGLKFSKKPGVVILGLLPSLRIKEDKAVTYKNSVITPSLGFGVTAVFKHIALQVPFYYNAKTASLDGKWTAGIGLGYKL